MSRMLKIIFSRLDCRPWLLTILIQVPSLRNYFAASSIPNPLAAWLAVSLLILVSAYVFLHVPAVRLRVLRLAQSRWVTVFLLAVIVFLSYWGYQKMEGIGQGGTGDDALVVPIRELLQGKWMYDTQLFDGAPISPGPGWLLLNGVLVVTGTFGLMNFFHILGTVLLVSRIGHDHVRVVNLTLIAMLSSFAFIEQLYSRQDLAAIGFAFLNCILLMEGWIDSKNWFWIGLFAGLTATARIIFLIYPIFIALLYFRRQPKVSLRFAGVATTSALACHLAAYRLSDFYQPMHLILSRGPGRVGMDLILVGAALSLLILFFALRDRSATFPRRLIYLALLFITPLIFISLGELRSGQFVLSRWEGARYWLPALPLALLALFTHIVAGEPPNQQHNG